MAHITDTMVLDIETSTIPGAADFLGHIQAPSNYKKPDAIEKYVAEHTDKELLSAALDPDLLRIVAVAWYDLDSPKILGYIAQNEDEERQMLTRLWKRVMLPGAHAGVKTIVGHNVLGFDLPALLRRSLYLGVPAPLIQIDRFRHPNVIDIQQVLSWDGKLKYRSKDFYCRRFGIHVDDPHTGADVATLVAAGDYHAVLAHAKADVAKEALLAARIGAIEERRVLFAQSVNTGAAA
jgi:3'-5' exonuclease